VSTGQSSHTTVVLTALTIMNNTQKLNNNFLDNGRLRLSYDLDHLRDLFGISPLAVKIKETATQVSGY
jgi:hypothetical protein